MNDKELKKHMRLFFKDDRLTKMEKVFFKNFFKKKSNVKLFKEEINSLQWSLDNETWTKDCLKHFYFYSHIKGSILNGLDYDKELPFFFFDGTGSCDFINNFYKKIYDFIIFEFELDLLQRNYGHVAGIKLGNSEKQRIKKWIEIVCNNYVYSATDIRQYILYVVAYMFHNRIINYFE